MLRYKNQEKILEKLLVNSEKSKVSIIFFKSFPSSLKTRGCVAMSS